MHIMLTTRDVSLSPGHRFDIERRLGRLYRKTSDSIRKIKVTFADVNGVKGGVDKQCKIELRLDGERPVLVKSRKNSLEKAFVDALHRANHALFRKIEKRKNSHRSITLA